MSRIVNRLSTAAAALVLSAGLALAQAPQPAQTPPAATPPPAAVAKDVAPVKKSTAKKTGPTAQADRTPESIACSAELDAKNIHGKPRAAALRKCKAEAAKKGKAAATPAAAKK